MSQLNNFTDHKKENELNLLNCKCRDPDYFTNLTSDFKRKALSSFFPYEYLLTKNFDDFNILLIELNVNFDILAIRQ